MKIVALDYGQKKVGVAVSDAGGSMAFPRCTLRRGEIKAAFFAELLALLEREQAEAVLVGLPLHVDGAECLATRQARNFMASLKRRSPLPVYWINEVLSSCEAESDLREVGLSLERAREVVDQQAAVRILQSFLSQPEELRTKA
jgi:putative Holliday junction resolvase